MSIFGKMRPWAWRFVLSLVLASPALAEAVPREGPVVTPSGNLTVIEIEGSDAIALRLGEKILLAEEAYRDVRLFNRIGDLVLVYVSFGRSACPGAFMWLHTAYKDVRLSEQFGTCSDDVAIRTTQGEVRVALGTFSEGSDIVEFAYDGQTVERRMVGE